MDAKEHVERTAAAMAPHWDLTKPWPLDGPVADRLLLCATGGAEDRLELFELAVLGTDDAVAVAAREIRERE